MSDKSQGFRDKAAQQLRASRKSDNPEEKSLRQRRAGGLKQLAANEEWLDGKELRRPTK